MQLAYRLGIVRDTSICHQLVESLYIVGIISIIHVFCVSLESINASINSSPSCGPACQNVPAGLAAASSTGAFAVSLLL